MAGRGARHDGDWVDPMALTEKDTWHSAEARQIQQSHRGWLVMWSVWRRTFTAFSCFSTAPVVVDAPTTQSLLIRMHHVELYYGSHQLAAMKGSLA
jgi:hypothetical protein